MCRRSLLILLLVVPAQAGEPARPLIVGHRGLLNHAPENTLAGFRAALELRLGFEFDVARTKDGHLVCIHDNTVNRTTDGQGSVSTMTLEAIRRLDAGSWFDGKFAGEKVPTVDEVLRLLAAYEKQEVLVTVDLKEEGIEEDVVKLAEKHKILHRLLFIGRTITEAKVRRNLKEASRSAVTSALANDAGEFSAALAADADWVYLRFIPTREQMDDVHQKGKRAFIAGKTVAGNLPDNWRKTAEVGMDGVLTDYPLDMAAALRKSGKK